MKSAEKDNEKDKKIQSLQKELDTLKSIINMMPGNIYWKNTEGQYLGCNYNALKTINLDSSDQVKGKTLLELLVDIEPSVAKKIEAIDIAVIKSEQEKRVEEVGIDPLGDGKQALYISHKSPLYDRKGKLIGMLGVSLDITERKEMERRLTIAKQKAEAANRAKSAFLALVSHELRTPLTSILGFANFVERDKLEPHQKKYIKHIINSGSYLLSLINNLLDYSRLETNKFKLINTPLNLKTLMEDVITMLGSTAKLKKLTLKLDYEKTAPKKIAADSRLLRQVLVNLVGNAIKFTEKGHVILKVRALETTKSHTYLDISVEDTGIGISAQDQKSIFKRFYQVGNVYTRNASLTGTGLGLAIVKKLLKLLDSKIHVKSTLNYGSTFHFSARFARSENMNETTDEISPPPAVKKRTTKKTLKALLVEDNELIQLIHKKMLEECDCETDTIETANQALTMLNNQYDILFVDIGLPDLDGFELIKKIRQRFKKSKLPIIALTGYSGEEVQQHCIDAGANEIVTKPISKSIFENLLSKHLSL